MSRHQTIASTSRLTTQSLTQQLAHYAASTSIQDISPDVVELAKKVIALAGSKSQVQFQSYTQAYDQDFEDIRHRVPDLTRLRQTLGYAPTFDLTGIIQDCLRAQGERA